MLELQSLIAEVKINDHDAKKNLDRLNTAISQAKDSMSKLQKGTLEYANTQRQLNTLLNLASNTETKLIKQIDDYNEKLATLNKQTAKSQDEQSALNEEIAQTALALVDAETALKSYFEANNPANEQIGTFQKIGKEISELTAKQNELNLETTEGIAKYKDYQKEINALQRKRNDIQSNLETPSQATPQGSSVVSNLFPKLSDIQGKFQQSIGGVGLRLGGAVSSIAAPLLALGTIQGIKDLGSQAIDTAGKFEQLKTTLKTTLGSQSLAESAFKKIQDFAKSTPFQVDEITETFIKLANRGINPSTTQLTKIGDVASALGKPLGQVTEAILDINNTERWNELGVKVVTNGNKITGTFKGLTVEADRTEKGALKMIEAFGGLNGIAGGMEAQSKTLEGLKSNFQDNIDALMMNIGDRLLPMAKSYYSVLNSIVGTLAETFAPDYSEKLRAQGQVIESNEKEVKSSEKLYNEYQKLLSGYNSGTDDVKQLSDKALQLSNILGKSAVVSVGDLRKELDVLSKQTTPKTVEEQKRLVEIETTLTKVLKDSNLSIEEQNKILLANTLGVEANIKAKKLARDRELVSIVEAQKETESEITAIQENEQRIREQLSANSRVKGFQEKQKEFNDLLSLERANAGRATFGGLVQSEAEIRRNAVNKLNASKEVKDAIMQELELQQELIQLERQKPDILQKAGKISKELNTVGADGKKIADATLNVQTEKLTKDAQEIEGKKKSLALEIETNRVEREQQLIDRKKAENDLIVNGNLREASSKRLEIEEINLKLGLDKQKALKEQAETMQNIVQLETDLATAQQSYIESAKKGASPQFLAEKQAQINAVQVQIGKEKLLQAEIEKTFGKTQKDATTGQVRFITNDSEKDKEAQAKVKKLLQDQAKAYREYAKELRDFNNQVRDSGLDLRQSFNELLPESSLERANATLALDLEKINNTYQDKIKDLQDSFRDKGYGKAQQEELKKQIANLQQQSLNEQFKKQIEFNQKINELNTAETNRLNEINKVRLEGEKNYLQNRLDILDLEGEERLGLQRGIFEKEDALRKIENEKAQQELKDRNQGLNLAVANAELMLVKETNEKKREQLGVFINETRGQIIANNLELLAIQENQKNAELQILEDKRKKEIEIQQRSFEEKKIGLERNQESSTTGVNINQLRAEIDAVDKNERLKKDIAFKYSQEILAINKEANLKRRILLDEQIQVVEDRLASERELYGAGTKETIENLASLNKERKQLIKDDLDNTKKAEEEKLNYRREKTRQTIDTIRQIADVFFDSANKIVQAWQQANEEQIKIQENRVDKAREVAETGNVEQLELEKKRLEDLRKERKKAADAERAITLAQIVLQQILMVANVAATSATLSPFAIPIAIASALLAVGAGIASAKAQATAYRKGGKVKGNEQLIRVNEEGEEFVVSAKPTQASPKLLEAINKGKFTDKEYLRLTNLPTMKAVQQVNTVNLDSTNKKLDEVITAISAFKPNTIAVDVKNKSIIELYEKHQSFSKAIKNR